MTLPGDLTTTRVTGTFLDPAGVPQHGTITFTPSAVLTDVAGTVIVEAVTRRYVLSAAGTFTTDPLVSTDNTVQPTGWTYVVNIAITGQPPVTWNILLPHSGSPVDISGIAPAVPQPAVISYDTAGAAAAAQSGAEAFATSAVAAETSRAEAAEALALAKASNLSDVGTRQTALNNLAGSQVPGRYLRSDGTNTTLSAITAGDVPALNQNTTGTAAGLSATLAVASGGTGSATQNFPAVFNVKGFGAAGNGTTDDTTAVQAAFTAAQTSGGAVFVPAGTYKVSSAITYTSSSPLKVYGDGYASYLRTSSPTADVLTITGVTGLEIEDIRTGTSAGTPTAGAGLDLITCNTVRIKNYYTSNCWNGMATSGGGAPITILESWVEGANYGLYLLQNSLHAFSTGFSGGSVGCVLDSTGGAIRFLGCDFYGALSLTTRNSLSIGSPNQGIWIIDGEANYEAGTNPPEGPGGFNLDWAKGEVHVVHCWLSGNGLTFGASATSPTSISITGGTFGGASYAMPNPIKISAGTQVEITGATIQGSASSSYDSVLIGSAVQACSITGNTFANSTAQYHVNSSATTGPVVVAANTFKLATPVNYPSASAGAYTFAGNSSGPSTTQPSVTTWAASTAYNPGQLLQLPTGGLGYYPAAGTSASTWTAERTAGNLTFLPGGHYELLTTSATWTNPAGITAKQIRGLSGGGGGGGGGSASSVTTQPGGAGGGAGVTFNAEDTTTGNVTVTVGAAGARGNGAASGGAAGSNGGQGGATTCVSGSVTWKASGGYGGKGGAANSSSTTSAGLAGGADILIGAAVSSTYGLAGQGGTSTTGTGNASYPLDGVAGGPGGAPANSASVGGLGATGQVTLGTTAQQTIATGTGTVNGGAATAPLVPGAGGAGGGGGAQTGTGGNGSAGGAGQAEFWF